MKRPESQSSSSKNKQYVERRRRPLANSNDRYSSMENSPDASRSLSRSFSSSSRPQSALLSEDLSYHSSRPQSQYFIDDPTLSSSTLPRTGSDLSFLFVPFLAFPVPADRELTNILRKDNAVVIIMGVTGSGKSTFISLLADQSVNVGHSLHSSTMDIGIYSFTNERNKTITLVDTPGFDDTTRSDADILKDVAFFLAQIYEQKLHFAGCVYLHRITDSRMQASALKNLRVFEALCGENNFKHVVVVTTMWEDMKSSESGAEIGRKRQEQLRRPEFFGKILGEGRDIMKHDGLAESARGIVYSLTRQNEDVVLQIQQELIDDGISLDMTKAGQYLRKDFIEAKTRLDNEVTELRKSMEDALKERDEDVVRAIEGEKRIAEAKAARYDRDQESLSITMQQLAREKHPQYLNLAISLRDQAEERLPSSELLETNSNIDEWERELQENNSQRERGSSSRSHRDREAQSSHSRRGRDQAEQIERLEQRSRDLERKLAVERRRRREAERRESPISTFLNAFSGSFRYFDDDEIPQFVRRSSRSDEWNHRR